MIRKILPLLLLVCAGGCLRPVICRVDEFNAQVREMNAQMREMNEKLTVMGEKLDVANQKLGTFEKAARIIVPGLDKK